MTFDVLQKAITVPSRQWTLNKYVTNIAEMDSKLYFYHKFWNVTCYIYI